MEKYVESITKTYTHELGRSAIQYLQAGLDLFHKQRQKYYGQSYYEQAQVALGNLSIAVELMLKTLIAKNNLGLILKNIPLELKVVLSCPKGVPESFNWRRYDIDLRSFSYKTIELDECISCFYIFFPELRQTLQPHLRFLSKFRNMSLHSALPSFHQYELDRVTFLALQIFNSLQDNKVFDRYYYMPSKLDLKFLKDFQAERIERVKKVIEKAKEQSRKISHKGSAIIIDPVDFWDFYVFTCPICDSDGTFIGHTEETWIDDEDGGFPSLDFHAGAFWCDECNLSLDDVAELELAGIDTHHDRADDVDRWLSEKGHPFEDY